MTDTLELEVAITRQHMTKVEIAKRLGITTMGLYKKIHNLSEFKASEIVKLSEMLKLTLAEKESIFFASNVDLKSAKEA